MSIQVFIAFFISATLMICSLIPFVVYAPMIEKDPVLVLTLIPHVAVFAFGFRPAIIWLMTFFTSILSKMFDSVGK